MTASVPFAFNDVRLDRAMSARTDAAWVARQLADPRARAVVAATAGVAVDGDDAARLHRTPVDDALAAESAILLGIEQGAALFALDLDGLDVIARAQVLGAGHIAGLRDAAATLAQPEGGIAALAASLLGWHRTHRFCPNCGSPTAIAEAGTSRRCPSCGRQHFPRVDPVVIATVQSEGRLLLGRHAGWPVRQYSALAGFIASGETVAEAVVREVREESGIDVYASTFVASQPWPYPSSLMLGCHADAHPGEPAARDGELEDVRWFTVEEVGAALSDGEAELRVPPRISIAHFLIERWHASQARAVATHQPKLSRGARS